MQTNSVNITPVINNFGDARFIMAYSHYLVMKGQLAGNFQFDSHQASDEERGIVERCRELCDRIIRSLSVCKECEIPEMLECYDVICRMGYKRIPDKSLIDHNRMRVFKAWKNGAGDIDESKIFGIVVSDASCFSIKNNNEYLESYLAIKEKWLATLVKYDCFHDAPAYENYQRLALFMHENIVACSNGSADEMKRRWYEYNKVEDLSKLGTLTLRSYRRFVNSSFPTVLDFDEKMELDNKILQELAIRRDLNHYDREAFSMTLEFNKKMIDN